MRGHALVLFSGLPGTGKTALARGVARDLAIPLLAKDRIQSTLRLRGLAPRETADGYHLMFDLADEQLSLGVSVILDAVFPMSEFRLLAREIAHRHSARFRAVHCYCSDVKVWQERMQERQQYVPDWTPVGWSEAKRLRETYEPWQPQEALFVDAVDPLRENLERVLGWLRTAEHA